MNRLKQMRTSNSHSRHSHSPSPPSRHSAEAHLPLTAARPDRLRILCLHGYHGSAAVMRAQLGSLGELLAPYADLITVDAPALDKGDFGWWHATSSPFTQETSYQGWERTQIGLGHIFKTQGPFDGILGFSQGAILAGLLCGMNGVTDLPIKFDFAIMVGGFLARDKELAKVYALRELYNLPTLHVYGTSDFIVDAMQSEKLSLRFQNPQIIIHSGGHVIESSGDSAHSWVSFIKQQLARKQRPHSYTSPSHYAHTHRRIQHDHSASTREEPHGSLQYVLNNNTRPHDSHAGDTLALPFTAKGHQASVKQAGLGAHMTSHDTDYLSDKNYAAWSAAQGEETVDQDNVDHRGAQRTAEGQGHQRAGQSAHGRLTRDKLHQPGELQHARRDHFAPSSTRSHESDNYANLHAAADHHGHHAAAPHNVQDAATSSIAARSHPRAATKIPLWKTGYQGCMNVFFPASPSAIPSIAMVVFRGGAYSFSMGSGGGTAEWAAAQGFVGVEVDYGTKSTARFFPDNISDGARAVRMVRANAQDWGVDPDKVVCVGFSAGGHMAATLATQPLIYQAPEDDLVERFSPRPNAVVLAYGVLSFVDGYHPGAYLSTVGNFFGTEKVSEERRRQLSSELYVRPDAPPAFVWTVQDDRLVPPSQTQLYADACRNAGVSVELRMYDNGGHGIGLALNTHAKVGEWTADMLQWLTTLW